MAYKSLVYTISCLIYHLQNRTIGDVLNIPHIHHRADAIHPLGADNQVPYNIIFAEWKNSDTAKLFEDHGYKNKKQSGGYFF